MKKIDPKRLSLLRKREGREGTGPAPSLLNGLESPQRTIQRCGKRTAENVKKPESTPWNRLAKALGVEPGVLTGELPLPESDKAPARPRARPNRRTGRAKGATSLRPHQTPIWRQRYRGYQHGTALLCASGRGKSRLADARN